MEHGGFQGVEKIARGVRAQRADIPCSDQIDVFDPMDALDQLLDQGIAASGAADAGKRQGLSINGPQRGRELSGKLAVFRSHKCTVTAARVIQRRTASLTWVVTPKLLWMLWLKPSTNNSRRSRMPDTS